MLVISISRYHEQPNQIGPQIGFNNQARNPRLINNMLCILIIAMYLSANVVLTFRKLFLTKKHFELHILALAIGWGLIFPSLVYCFSPRVRHFYVRIFWDEAPDWVQQFNPNRVVEIHVNHY